MIQESSCQVLKVVLSIFPAAAGASSVTAANWLLCSAPCRLSENNKTASDLRVAAVINT